MASDLGPRGAAGGRGGTLLRGGLVHGAQGVPGAARRSKEEARWAQTPKLGGLAPGLCELEGG